MLGDMAVLWLTYVHFVCLLFNFQLTTFLTHISGTLYVETYIDLFRYVELRIHT